MIELADIVAPVAPPPAPPPFEWIALGVVLLLLVLFFVLRLWLKRTRTRRLSRAILKRTERALQLGQLDARVAAFQIARAVGNAPPLPTLYPHGVRRWVPRCFAATLPQSHKGRGESFGADAWAAFKQDLDRARFSAEPIDTQQATQLLKQARHWIAHVA